MTKIMTHEVIGARLARIVRLEERMQPWAGAGPIEVAIRPGTEGHRVLVAAAVGLLLGLGPRRPIRPEPELDAAVALAEQWLEIGADAESLSAARESFTGARLDRLTEAKIWTDHCDRLFRQPGTRAATYLRARRKLARRELAVHRTRAGQWLIRVVEHPVSMNVNAFLADVARAAAAAEVVELLDDDGALAELGALGWIHEALVAIGSTVLEERAEYAGMAALTAAAQLLQTRAAPAFKASAVLFLDWLLDELHSAIQFARAHA